MNKEELYLKSRIMDLANIAYNKGIYAYSDFLNLNQINIFNNVKNILPPVNVSLTGGNVYAERKIIIFKPMEAYYDEEPPITVVKVEPVNEKFSDDLTHRDFLGAILNLGIDRAKIGDIFLNNNTAYIYCISGIADYITEQLYKVKHTNVKCSLCVEELENIKPKLKEIRSTISNIRLDSVTGIAFNRSRSKSAAYIGQGKVFVNGKLITSNGYTLKDNDIISVRGLGRVIYNTKLGTTKKGRNLISIFVYE